MTESQSKLYEKAKQYAKKNVKGNCDELKCLAEMLYEFATEATKELQEKITHLERRIAGLENELTEAKEIVRELCGTVRALNSPNVQLTDVNGFLQKAEAFIKEE